MPPDVPGELAAELMGGRDGVLVMPGVSADTPRALGMVGSTGNNMASCRFVSLKTGFVLTFSTLRSQSLTTTSFATIIIAEVVVLLCTFTSPFTPWPSTAVLLILKLFTTGTLHVTLTIDYRAIIHALTEY